VRTLCPRTQRPAVLDWRRTACPQHRGHAPATAGLVQHSLAAAVVVCFWVVAVVVLFFLFSYFFLSYFSFLSLL
jgi:hypothetical protein